MNLLFQMYNSNYIRRYLVFVFIFFIFVSGSCYGYVDEKRIDFSCSDNDFYDCVKLLESNANISINIDASCDINLPINVNISNATLYESINIIFKQAKIRNYYINNDKLNQIYIVKILDNNFNKQSYSSSVIKKYANKSGMLGVDEVNNSINNENMGNSSFSSAYLEALEKETQIILDDRNKPDIFVQQDYLERLQAETDKLVQQEKISESNILPQHLEMLHKVDSDVHVETELSGEDLELLKALN